MKPNSFQNWSHPEEKFGFSLKEDSYLQPGDKEGQEHRRCFLPLHQPLRDMRLISKGQPEDMGTAEAVGQAGFEGSFQGFQESRQNATLTGLQINDTSL